MATVFISYKQEDKEAAIILARLLEEKKHEVSFDQELFIGSSWREQLLKALLSSDALVVLWSKDTFKSQFVPAEIGAVRATPRIGLLPVIVGDIAIPRFIQDLTVKRIYDTQPQTLEALAGELDASIKMHIEYRNLRKRGKPKVFISHRHRDEAIVRALLNCMETYFLVNPKDIRCTSVWPYRLLVGENTSDRLRDEISDAEVVLGILTTDALASSYVAFELGSAWGQRVWTCPLLACGANQSHIPDPIRDLSPLFLTNESDCFQLLKDMEDFTTLTRNNFNQEELEDKVRCLAEAAKKT